MTLRRPLYLAALGVALGVTLGLPATPAWALCPDFGLPEGTKVVEIETSLGSICLELLSEDATDTVDNFIGYVERGDYDGTFLHRSLPGFIVQGGGFRLDGQNDLAPVPTEPAIPNEPCELDAMQGGSQVCSERGNERGTVAMAKRRMEPNSATNQWFVNLADNRTGTAQLDTQNEGFTVFARVLGESMAVVDEIAGLPAMSTERMYWLDPSFVRLRAGLFDATPLRSLVPLLPDSPNFGCFDPTRLVAVVDPEEGVGQNDLVRDPITEDVFFFVGADCATPIEDPSTFEPQLGPESCPEDSQRSLAVDAPINPATQNNPQGAPFPVDFDGDGVNDEFEVSCLQKQESLDLREAWRADFKARLAPELVVIERATLIQVPEPGAEALAVGALAALSGLRRIRRCRAG